MLATLRHVPAGQRLGNERQSREGARNSDPFSCRAQIEPHPPGEPGGAGAEARVPSPSRVELTDQGEQTRGGGVKVRGQLGDLVAEPVQLRDRMSGGHRRRIDLYGEPSFS